jgi:hypothetical protein
MRAALATLHGSRRTPRRIRPNAKREREQSMGGEPWALAKLAQRVTHVLDRSSHLLFISYLCHS